MNSLFAFDQNLRNLVTAQCRTFTRAPARTSEASLKHAAVAIVMVRGDDGDGAFLLTLRASSLRAHSNQWALPGGRSDPGETAPDAARRELSEELGLLLPADDVLGALDDYPTRSGYIVTPVVMWADDSASLRLNPHEVASVHRITLASIVRDDAFDFISIPESDRRVIRFNHGGQLIHAPTAAMIFQFRELLAGRTTRVDELEQPVFAWR